MVSIEYVRAVVDDTTAFRGDEKGKQRSTALCL